MTAPNASWFTYCHPQWTYDLATLLRKPGLHRSFGLFGRWGAGKSSACEANPVRDGGDRARARLEVRQ